MTSVRVGLENAVDGQADLLNGRRFALVMNRASVDRELRLSCDVLSERFPGQLTALLTPQHGLWCEQQANMIETAHGWHPVRNVPVFSLYSETRRPTDRMLAGIDCLVIDLQDVGTRVYTFIWTMLYCLQECAVRRIPVIVLDRPNPIGGCVAEGPLLDLRFRSFVGEASIPMRHGLTIGELARYFNATLHPQADLSVIPMSGWSRELFFEDCGRVWVPPSPNMPTVFTACVYPGQVLLEGTGLSEGRGTTTPFEVFGAPFVDPQECCDGLSGCGLPGVRFLPLRFTPAFDKWAGQSCGGVSIHVTDRAAFRSWDMTLQLLRWCCRRYPDQFLFTSPPYEYEQHHRPIDIISGTSEVREWIVDGSAERDCPGLDEPAWWRAATDSLIYT